MMTITAYIALGSNLDNPSLQLQQAVNDINAEQGITVEQSSRLYRSDPVGPKDQPDYCNAVVSITTSLPPEVLLNRLQEIENRRGRIRTVKWGARTLDLDILLYGDQIVATERLSIPHNQMHLRSFVLYPLSDIAPQLKIPHHGDLSSLLNKVNSDGLDVISENWLPG